MSANFAPILFGFALFGLISFVVSGLAACRYAGFAGGFFGWWISVRPSSWRVASAPVAGRFFARLVNTPLAAAR